MKRTRLALFKSIISLLLCLSMLTGTTFAWFTDSVTSGNNLIAAGNLDVELEYLDSNGKWKSVDESTPLLDNSALWEPGHTQVVYLKISNAGSLALKYAFGIGILKEISSINVYGDPFKLSDYIQFGIIESDSEPTLYAERADALKALSQSWPISQGYNVDGAESGMLYPAGKGTSERYVTLVVYMPESVTNEANYRTGAAVPEIKLGVNVVATQTEYENDSFGANYDTNAGLDSFDFPENPASMSASVGISTNDNKVAQAAEIHGEQASAAIPEGVAVEEGTNTLTLTVDPMAKSDANITLGENEAIRSLNVHMTGVSADNTVPMEITIKEAMPTGLNMGNYKFYHVENGATVEMTMQVRKPSTARLC